MKNKCKFDKSWVGPCNKKCEGEMCTEHKDLKCASCGTKATRSCDHTGQFVCGYPLCDSCRHGIPPEGQYGMFDCGGGHVTYEVYDQQWKERYNGYHNKI